jgi:hypothetical protein
MQTAVYDAPGARQELLTLLETQSTDTVELAVALHVCVLPGYCQMKRVVYTVSARCGILTA